ncbi:flagellar biosynthesis protein FliQ [Polynucleobacter paneuropaeus]|jgi:flagellar biosynthetic protein FliQ|nr:flagellar biosynthesis protein FliQ [Polynucleobacter paneuropaeus]QWD13728.1 flagellar biosynthesis protein FliQ [Polynucleobacter paneuropaeus]QWD32967.1 flagellar biosynthesis protein FliQ [Polynucleobacter paneuropaeus]
MSPESVMNIGRLAMETTLMVAAPLLLVALIVGLIVSVFQAATQINEATLSFIPKLLSVFITLLLVGPWMLSVLVGYMRGMFSNFSLLMG